MSDDWKVGDLAVCVNAGSVDGHPPCPSLREGATYRVANIEALRFRGARRPFLSFSDCSPVAPDTGKFDSIRFRKIRPDEHEDCEPEFATLLESFKVPAPLSEEGVL